MAREAWLRIFYEDGVFLGLGEERCTPSALCDIFQGALGTRRGEGSHLAQGFPFRCTAGLARERFRWDPRALLLKVTPCAEPPEASRGRQHLSSLPLRGQGREQYAGMCPYLF